MGRDNLGGAGAVRVPAEPLLGRARELAEIASVLAGGVRIVSLVGPPGVGKSRLALHAVGVLQAGTSTAAAFVPLSAVATCDVVLPAIGQTLCVPDGEGSLLARVARVVTASGPALLVLDNLEHLPGVGPIVAELVASCPGLQVLATSRERLRIPGEHAVHVRPLDLPDPGAGLPALEANPAVALFVARAAGGHASVSRSDLPSVGAICTRLDGLPLAIELAAARVALLGTRGLLAAIETSGSHSGQEVAGMGARHASLDDAIGWSYRLLARDERALFRRLAVFPGGFVLDAAERMARGREAGAPYPYADGHEPIAIDPENFVLRPGYSPVEAVDGSAREGLAPLEVAGAAGLERLLEANLVRPTTGADGAPRFEMLRTIQGFGLRRLAESGEEEATRHAAAAITLAYVDAANHELWSFRGSAHRWRRLPEELGNIRDALAWATCADRPRAELANRLAAQMWYGFQLLGLVPEARAWLERALALPGAPVMVRGATVVGVGFVGWTQGDDQRTEAACAEVLGELSAASAEVAASAFVGSAHFLRALVGWRRGDVGPMMQALGLALAAYQAARDKLGVGNCNLALGVVARMTGDRTRARAHFAEAYRLHAEMGYAWGLATARYYAGETAHDGGDTVEAARLIGDGLDRYWAEGDRWGAGACAAGLAVLAAERGEHRRAARLLGGAFSMSEGIGAVLPPLDLDRYRVVSEEVVRPKTGDAPFDEGRATSPDETVAAARRLAEEIVAGLPPRERNRLQEALTVDQHEAVELVCGGMSVAEIAELLSKSDSTIYARITRAKHRLDATTDGQLIARANELRGQVAG